MTINRHNYETYFLLYVDNELSVEERSMVENFVHENPDLKKELDLLFQTALPLEEFKFDLKEGLIKKDSNVFQENLLLYLDNELVGSEKESLVKKINENTSVQKEWEILRLTKLDKNEVIVFEHKSSLYRHERTGVISMRVWRIAAAAAVIMFGLFIGGKMLFNRKQSIDVANTGKAPANTIAITNDKKETNINVVPKVDGSNGTAPSTSPVIARNNEASEKRAANNNITNRPSTDIANHGDQRVKKQSLNKVQPTYPSDNFNNNNSNQSTASNVEPKKEEGLQKKIMTNTVAINEPKKMESRPLTSPDVEITSAIPNPYAGVAMMENQEEENNNKIFFIEEKKVTHSKVGGFFRKIKRTIERKANLKPGKSIKIAGFEIASK